MMQALMNYKTDPCKRTLLVMICATYSY